MMPISVSDSTSVSFDPFSDQGKKLSQTFNIKSNAGLSLSTMLPVMLILVAVFVIWKFLK